MLGPDFANRSQEYSTSFSRSLGIIAAATALTSALVAARHAQSQDEPLVVSTAWLASHLNDPSIVVIQVEHDDSYNEGHIPAVARGHLTVQPHPEKIATADWITAHLGKPGVSLIDTRTDGEYVGAGERHGMPSAGHIPGARQLQWEQLFRDGDSPLLKDRAELQRLYAARVNPGDTVATYCWMGYRASMTYFIARYLGYPVKLYDGSYQDWLQRKLPVKAGATP